MAESGSHKGGIFAKAIQKRVVRTKEKVLQHLGQADRTTDDIFDEHVNNFQKQQNVANRLQKELKNYITCVKAMSVASKTFYEAIQDTYEEEWVDHEEVTKAVNALNILWEDYLNKLNEQVQPSLQAYICRFPEVRAKIAKRGRKIVDYDSKRHTVESLQNAKKKDDVKIQKAEEELVDAKKIYEDMNNELREELPALYEQRKNFVSSSLNSLFSVEVKFDEETAKTKAELVAVADKLSEQCGPNMFISPPTSTMRYDSEEDNLDRVGEGEGSTGLSKFYKVSLSNDVAKRSSSKGSKDSDGSPQVPRSENGLGASNGEVNLSSTENLASGATEGQTEETEEDRENAYEFVGTQKPVEDAQPYEPVNMGEQMEEKAASGEEGEGAAAPEPTASDENAYSMAGDTDDIYKSPGSNEPVDPTTLGDGVLYLMEAIHPYNGEDTDELTFDTGEVIEVIPFEDPDDQDDGWLMGRKQVSREKGVFPANFCKRI